MICSIHHIAIICSDYQVSKKFYTEIIGLKPIREVYRQERNSYKLDLALNEIYIIELFSFPNPPKRSSFPESTGLRHIAFSVTNLSQIREGLIKNKVSCEEIRIDEFTGKEFFFAFDPDNLPLEFYSE